MKNCKQIATEWGLSERTVNDLCKKNKIDGAIKVGKMWKIPDDAKKPIDGRITSGKYVRHSAGVTRKPLPIGISDYVRAQADYYYVDKTMLIKEFLDQKPLVSLFTRPRRFGKTLNMDMLRVFFEISEENTSKYFEDKAIWQCGEEYRNQQGQYPVVFLTFKDVKFDSWKATLDKIRDLLQEEFGRHQELATSERIAEYEKTYFAKIINGDASEVDLTASLAKLSQMLTKHYGKAPIIIIDEYDTPIQEGYSKDFYDEIIGFMRNFFSGAFKDNKNLTYGFLTGILRIAQESIFSGLNNLTVNSVMDEEYDQFFGFTVSEVREMLKYYGVLDKEEELKDWYDGYLFGSTEIYNPWSVINYISRGCIPQAYWVNTGKNEILEDVLKVATEDITERLYSLLQGERVIARIDQNVVYRSLSEDPANIYSLLLVAGYLKTPKKELQADGSYLCEVSIPNREIAAVYKSEVLSHLLQIGAITRTTANKIAESLYANDYKNLQKAIAEYMDKSVSFYDAGAEGFYHGLVLGLIALMDNQYKIKSNRDYFRGSVMKNESVVNKLIMFFATYFDAPYEGDDLNGFFNNIAKANYSTMRSDLEDFKREVIDTRTKKSVTIQNEILRSHQEVEIANFLYLNNIEYEYEPIYQYNIQYSHKPYTPDFVIYQNGKIAYIEHFGITENGKNDRYSQDELEQYKKAINDKIKLHKQHDTTLIYTFSVYNDGKPLTEHLQEALEVKGFELKPRSNKEVMELLVAGEENRYVRKLINLICRFISNFKVNGYNAEEFNRMYHSTQNVRSRLFLEICHDCYLEYDRWLKENKAVDFEDMINESARLLREVKEMKQKLSFKYIIVDEYQDISRQRFDLTKALSEVTDAKIIAVGDDWQSIYAFSGSDITLFTKFSEKMGYAKMLKIVKTYRNSQEVIDIAGNFIQKNSEQIRKRLLSPKNITDPVIIYTYDSTAKGRKGDRRSGSNYAVAHAVETALTQLIMYKKQEGRQPGTILLLGRYAFDGDHLEKSGLFEFVRGGSKIKSVKYPKLDITFMTAHSSKGLGYDDVIIVNGKNETYGFPSKIEDDPVLAFVIKGDRSIDYAEERRLFYVAMTRTKNRVFFVAPEQNPSEFLLELKKDYKNVVLHGNWNEEKPQSIAKKSCPLCGYPMQLKYKRAYGLRLYICTNEPEICGFMTNDYRAGKLCIQKCDKCRDGYLVVKSSKENGYFLGCTNYKTNGTGCNKSIGMKYYYDQMGYRMEIVTESPVAISRIEKENPVKRVAVTQVSTDDYVEIEKTTAASVRYKRWILNNVVDTVLRALQDVSKVN